MKKVFALLLCLTLIFTLSSCVKTDNNIENYTSDVEKYHAGSFMPKLEDIGEYDEISYFSKKDETIFPAYSMQLVVKYGEEAFLQEKERLQGAYTYLDKPQKPDGDDSVYTIPMEKFSASGYDFRIALFEDTDYPKNFGMVGVSGEKFEIAYLWLYAPDLDYICEADENEIKGMNEFIEQYFSLE